MGDSVGQKVPQTVAPDQVGNSGGSFNSAVRLMFNALAPRYDSFNHFSSLGLDYGWRRATVRSLKLTESDLVLDIATGTGDLAFATTRSARGIVGCDFAVEMIRRAHAKVRPGDGTWFHVACAECLPYCDERFQGVTSAFAMRNVKPILEDVLAEAFRVLEPGGRAAILEFSRPRMVPIRWGHSFYTRLLMPRVGRFVTGTVEPFHYLYRSIQEWYSPDEFAEILRTVGFTNVRYRMMSFGTVALHTGTKPTACRL
ncbi:MAG: ubiquinone/menaquinone biosynthesis methyltransferase [Acidobacteriota bacterium]|nr:ubiquinone/menaquinone biosynthesis methyltransferase [Acidobacteriota bacterium]